MRTALRRIAKALASLGICATLLAGVLYLWLAATSVSAKDLPALQNGDIVFQTSGSSQSTAIFVASRSVYTHVGVIEINAAGQPHVVEAVGPVITTPLDDWIRHGTGNRITIKRVKDLSPQQAQAILQAAHAYDGLPYDPFFLPGKDAVNCSELVRLAFLEGAGITLGEMQKVKELDLDNFIANSLIERRWRKYPLCDAAGGETLQSCKEKIREQELVTPVSIAKDRQLMPVFSNYQPVGD